MKKRSKQQLNYQKYLAKKEKEKSSLGIHTHSPTWAEGCEHTQHKKCFFESTFSSLFQNLFDHPNLPPSLNHQLNKYLYASEPDAKRLCIQKHTNKKKAQMHQMWRSELIITKHQKRRAVPLSAAVVVETILWHQI